MADTAIYFVSSFGETVVVIGCFSDEFIALPFFSAHACIYITQQASEQVYMESGHLAFLHM